MMAGGGGWIAIVASLNVSAQTMSPAWLRARALSIYLLVLQGGMAAGSAAWGAVAERWGIERSMLCAALGMVLGLAAVRRFPIHAENMAMAAAGRADAALT